MIAQLQLDGPGSRSGVTVRLDLITVVTAICQLDEDRLPLVNFSILFLQLVPPVIKCAQCERVLLAKLFSGEATVFVGITERLPL